MNQALLALARSIVWCSLVLIAVVTIHDYVVEKVNEHTFEVMAHRSGCEFLAPLKSRRDVGIFNCHGDIHLKKLED